MNAKFITGGALSKSLVKSLFMGTCFMMVCLLTTSAKAVNENVVVAVIDTGIDTEHKDLKKSIWINAGETGIDKYGKNKSTNGIDDDGNGYADDIHGWNFVDNNNQVMDFEGHGTHIAGIINSQFAQKKHAKAELQLMALKYYSPKVSNQINIINTIKAIHYATLMRAQIVNYSAGGALPEFYELQAIQNARKLGIMMVVAAGNEQEDTDVVRYYPASYRLDNMISVAALQKDGGLTSFSNYGKNTVDIAAPGKLIYSTLPENRYGFLSGTSQATAFVTGHLAAVVADKKPATYKIAIESLFKQAVYSPALKGRTKFQMALLNEIP
ncbi:MAG: S8 family peptidase [Bdellovibrionota bacterium]